jgi:hypothetical protein
LTPEWDASHGDDLLAVTKNEDAQMIDFTISAGKTF